MLTEPCKRTNFSIDPLHWGVCHRLNFVMYTGFGSRYNPDANRLGFLFARREKLAKARRLIATKTHIANTNERQQGEQKKQFNLC